MAKKAKKKTPKKGKNHAQNKRKQTQQNAQNPQKNQAQQSKPQAPALPPVPAPLTMREWIDKVHPDNSKIYGWNDSGAGRLFSDWAKDKARYVPERKQWYAYDGTKWVPDIGNLKTMELLKAFGKELLLYSFHMTGDAEHRKEYGKFVGKWQTRAYRETILKDAASVYPISASMFDTNPMLLNCTNGTLNIATREFFPHTPADLLTKMAGVAFLPDAVCPRWLTFLEEVTEGDKDRALFLQKAIGYALTGDTSAHAVFIIHGGKSRNGKSTMIETVLQMLGTYGMSARPETIAQRLNTSGSSHSEDIARLNGARLVNIAEPDKQLVLSASAVKTLTGNDTIVARSLHEKSIEYKPQFKMFINTNHLPRVTDNTVFLSGRVKVIPFNRHFLEHERDPNLKATLTEPENLSGILNWALDGYKLMKETGLECPDSVLEATAAYQADNDKIARFISETMEQGKGYEVRTSEVYARYQDWCSDNGFVAGSIQTFSRDIEKTLTTQRKRPQEGGAPTTMIVGHRLLKVQMEIDMDDGDLPFR